MPAANIRIKEEPTPEGRIAAIARISMLRHVEMLGRLPDYADFRDAMSLQIQIEILIAKLDEAQLKPRNDARTRFLIGELADLHLQAK